MIVIEDILGDSGFRLKWELTMKSEYGDDIWSWANVTAYKMEGTIKGKPQFPREGAWGGPDWVEEIEKAEPYLKGFVKWDGCTELDMDQPHWCGASGYVLHCALLKHIWHKAFQLMNREEPEEWNELPMHMTEEIVNLKARVEKLENQVAELFLASVREL